MFKSQLLGRVGMDAVAKEINGMFVTEFNVASTESWMDKDGVKQERTTWVKVSKWDKSGKVANFIKKGDMIFVEGEVDTQAWMKEGEAKSQLVMRASRLELIGATKPTTQGEPVTANPDDKGDDLPF